MSTEYRQIAVRRDTNTPDVESRAYWRRQVPELQPLPRHLWIVDERKNIQPTMTQRELAKWAKQNNIRG